MTDPRDENEALSLRLAFDTDDKQFALGFEAGRLWEILQNPEPINAIVHGQSAEMLVRMAEATGRHLTTVEMGNDWVEARYGPAAGTTSNQGSGDAE